MSRSRQPENPRQGMLFGGHLPPTAPPERPPTPEPLWDPFVPYRQLEIPLPQPPAREPQHKTLEAFLEGYSLSSRINPSGFAYRSDQVRLLEALFESRRNTIVQAPTSFGKSYVIAALAAREMIAPPHPTQPGRTLILVPKLSLSVQFSHNIRSALHLSEREFAVITGRTPAENRRTLLSSPELRIAIATPEALFWHKDPATRTALFRECFQGFSLICPDEVHVFRGEYAGARLLRDVLPLLSQPPRVVGFSATPEEDEDPSGSPATTPLMDLVALFGSDPDLLRVDTPPQTRYYPPCSPSLTRPSRSAAFESARRSTLDMAKQLASAITDCHSLIRDSLTDLHLPDLVDRASALISNKGELPSPRAENFTRAFIDDIRALTEPGAACEELIRHIHMLGALGRDLRNLTMSGRHAFLYHYGWEFASAHLLRRMRPSARPGDERSVREMDFPSKQSDAWLFAMAQAHPELQPFAVAREQVFRTLAKGTPFEMILLARDLDDLGRKVLRQQVRDPARLHEAAELSAIRESLSHLRPSTKGRAAPIPTNPATEQRIADFTAELLYGCAVRLAGILPQRYHLRQLPVQFRSILTELEQCWAHNGGSIQAFRSVIETARPKIPHLPPESDPPLHFETDRRLMSAIFKVLTNRLAAVTEWKDGPIEEAIERIVLDCVGAESPHGCLVICPDFATVQFRTARLNHVLEFYGHRAVALAGGSHLPPRELEHSKQLLLDRTATVAVSTTWVRNGEHLGWLDTLIREAPPLRGIDREQEEGRVARTTGVEGRIYDLRVPDTFLPIAHHISRARRARSISLYQQLFRPV